MKQAHHMFLYACDSCRATRDYEDDTHNYDDNCNECIIEIHRFDKPEEFIDNTFYSIGNCFNETSGAKHLIQYDLPRSKAAQARELCKRLNKIKAFI